LPPRRQGIYPDPMPPRPPRFYPVDPSTLVVVPIGLWTDGKTVINAQAEVDPRCFEWAVNNTWFKHDGEMYIKLGSPPIRVSADAL
jgi:hypothetical protein